MGTGAKKLLLFLEIGYGPLLGAKQFSKYAQTLSHPKSTRIYMFLDLILDLYGHRGRKTTIFPR